jgi:hypothetical protein
MEFAYELYRTHRHCKCGARDLATGEVIVVAAPVYSVLDGGAPGDTCREICPHCGNVFDEPRMFRVIDQPCAVGGVTFRD